MATIGMAKYTCPLCDEQFRYMTQFSYSNSKFSDFECNLDFKPIGAVLIPTPLPKCPKCDFVFFEDLFNEDEINQLRKILQNNNIFEIEPKMPNYYYLAKEFELLDKDIEDIIFYYHSAVWENEKNKIFVKITKILMEYFEKIDRENDNYFGYQLIKVDFLRRLKRFSEAQDLINTLNNDKKFSLDTFGKILDYQLELIKHKDIDERKMPD